MNAIIRKRKTTKLVGKTKTKYPSFGIDDHGLYRGTLQTYGFWDKQFGYWRHPCPNKKEFFLPSFQLLNPAGDILIFLSDHFEGPNNINSNKKADIDATVQLLDEYIMRIPEKVLLLANKFDNFWDVLQLLNEDQNSIPWLEKIVKKGDVVFVNILIDHWSNDLLDQNSRKRMWALVQHHEKSHNLSRVLDCDVDEGFVKFIRKNKAIMAFSKAGLQALASAGKKLKLLNGFEIIYPSTAKLLHLLPDWLLDKNILQTVGDDHLAAETVEKLNKYYSFDLRPEDKNIMREVILDAELDLNFSERLNYANVKMLDFFDDDFETTDKVRQLKSAKDITEFLKNYKGINAPKLIAKSNEGCFTFFDIKKDDGYLLIISENEVDGSTFTACQVAAIFDPNGEVPSVRKLNNIIRDLALCSPEGGLDQIQIDEWKKTIKDCQIQHPILIGQEAFPIPNISIFRKLRKGKFHYVDKIAYNFNLKSGRKVRLVNLLRKQN